MLKQNKQTMETKHTKGEWAISGKKTTMNNYKVICNENPICQIFTTNQQAEANAKLIAAAPELLEALIEIEKELIDRGLKNTRIQFLAINAIKKATE